MTLVDIEYLRHIKGQHERPGNRTYHVGGERLREFVKLSAAQKLVWVAGSLAVMRRRVAQGQAE